MTITQTQFIRIFGRQNQNAEEIVNALNNYLPAHNIDTKLRISAFLAQAGHESMGFTRTTENLNYSAQGLLATFPKYFTSAQATAYARQPKRIGSRVYANRLGNGDEASGDGYAYRGRGYIQVTGKSNYQACGDAIDVDLIETPEYLETVDGACQSAVWFWSTHNLNSYADSQDFNGLTKRINGGLNGLSDRQRIYKAAIAVL